MWIWNWERECNINSTKYLRILKFTPTLQYDCFLCIICAYVSFFCTLFGASVHQCQTVTSTELAWDLD